MTTVPTLPGLYYEQVRARPTPSPLRSDVAGFVGRTRRGPYGRAVRVEGWREYRHHFGDLHAEMSLPYAIRGYFENGGQVAYVVRIVTAADTVAKSTWSVVKDNDMVQSISIRGGPPTEGEFRLRHGDKTSPPVSFGAGATEVHAALKELLGEGNADCLGGPFPNSPVFIRFQGRFAGRNVDLLQVVESTLDSESVEISHVIEGGTHAYRLRAATPGIWGHSLRVTIRYLPDDSSGRPLLVFVVRADREVTERFRVIVPGADEENEPTLEEGVARQSNLIRITTESAPPLHRLIGPFSPRQLDWGPLKFGDTEQVVEDQPAIHAYRAALARLCDEPEIAIMAAPGIADEVARRPGEEPAGQADPYLNFLAEAVGKAAELQDRLFVVDVLPDEQQGPQLPAEAAVRFADKLRDLIPADAWRRAAAVYHPWLRVDDPLGGVVAPLRTLPPSGHIAGVISRVDRDRGAHSTPANVPLHDAVDVETVFCRTHGGSLNDAGVNLVRCMPGRGLTVWGGRTLDLSRDGRFVAHRRFVHRLIRAVRRVAEPLVFDTNGPPLWLTLVRTVTTVLLEAFRSGALKGNRPEEAFRVRCDEQTNPLGEREQGRVVCEISLALAAPMEFITLRVAVSQTGQVEVFDA